MYLKQPAEKYHWICWINPGIWMRSRQVWGQWGWSRVRSVTLDHLVAGPGLNMRVFPSGPLLSKLLTPLEMMSPLIMWRRGESLTCVCVAGQPSPSVHSDRRFLHIWFLQTGFPRLSSLCSCSAVNVRSSDCPQHVDKSGSFTLIKQYFSFRAWGINISWLSHLLIQFSVSL